MNSSRIQQWYLIVQVVMFLSISLIFLLPQSSLALNINEYKDTISDSGPIEYSNHTLSFLLRTALSPSSIIELTPPAGFTVLSTSTFSTRNVELYVNGVPRVSSTTASPGVDRVEITPGSPGFFRYTLAPDSGIATDSQLELRIGEHTSGSLSYSVTVSTSTGTTTVQADVEPILNSTTTGVHELELEIYDGGLVAKEEFVIFLNDKVTMPNVDTTETVPPLRFNPAPTSTVGGTTLSVEISLETNELAVCKFETISGVDFVTMTNTFVNTGFLFHSQVVVVTANALNKFFVRCIDDEGNYNIDDFIIAFTVNDAPTGTANSDGDVEGDGTGDGNDGAGTGAGSGGVSGSADGVQPLEGNSSGPGGSGGSGGGGGSGGSSGTTAGGGFESTDAPYQSGDGKVIISGFAYPNSTVGVLVDGNFFDTTNANSDGRYSITLDEIARGVYTFGVYAEGSDDVRSSTFSTSFTVTGARTSALSNVNVSPSVLVTPDPVDPGETIVVSGYALPDSSITIQNGRNNTNSPKEHFAVSDSNGRWSTTIDTTGFSVDTYQIRAKAEQVNGEQTNYSEYTFYGVGQKADVPLDADLNRDGKVNLIDFSILLFWWNSNGGDSNPPADINRDGNVSLTDFSILLFNWTG